MPLSDKNVAENNVSTLMPSVFIRSSSNLQVTRTGIKSQMSLNFGQIGPLPSELGVLERLTNRHRLIIRNWCLQASLSIYDLIFVNLLV